MNFGLSVSFAFFSGLNYPNGAVAVRNNSLPDTRYSSDWASSATGNRYSLLSASSKSVVQLFFFRFANVKRLAGSASSAWESLPMFKRSRGGDCDFVFSCVLRESNSMFMEGMRSSISLQGTCCGGKKTYSCPVLQFASSSAELKGAENLSNRSTRR